MNQQTVVMLIIPEVCSRADDKICEVEERREVRFPRKDGGLNQSEDF